MRLSMTCDQGRKMPQQKELSKHMGSAVYFCEPAQPW
jgi:IS30 family transposase